MIKLAKHSDRIRLIDFLSIEDEVNVDLIAIVKDLDFEFSKTKIFYEEDDNGITSVLVKWGKHAFYYSSTLSFNSEYSELLNDCIRVRGKRELVKEISNMYQYDSVSEEYYMVRRFDNKIYKDVPYKVKKIKTVLGLSKRYDTMKEITEFGNPTNRRKYIKSTMFMLRYGVSLYVKLDRKFVGIASVTSESYKSGKVVAVATLKEYRGKGIAKSLMKELINIYNKRKMNLVLTTNNPKAKKLYESLGFVVVGKQMKLKRDV